MTFPFAPTHLRCTAHALLALAVAQGAIAAVDFNTQIRPIFNQNCVTCHGGVKSASNLSFIYRESATAIGKKSKRPVIKPGAPGDSELISRITSNDPDYRMPPADHAAALPPEKIALLRQWIKEGAPWQEHWAFVAPKPQTVPTVHHADWLQRGAVDHFILARLEREKLAPASEAPRAELLRRASLDLTGLPPTPEEIAAFVADPSPGAYEKQVDRLLASPHFGERWTSLWLDLARYADTKGYEKDAERQVWKYRDWLIDAFNRNLPYDQFVTEQLAGDLLPHPTLDDMVATSFHRQTQVNDEGGTDDEEYRTAAIIDRVATTWAVTSGITFNCVQCHSHPYEPIRQRDFYRFFAFFNETRDADFNSDYPTLRVPTDPARNAEAWKLQQEVDHLRHEVVSAGLSAAADTAQWRSMSITAAEASPSGETKLRGDELEVVGTVQTSVRYDLTLPVLSLSQSPVTALRLEGLPLDPEKARHTPERGFIVNQIELTLAYPDGSVRPVAVARFFPDTENLNTKTTKTIAAKSRGAAGTVATTKRKGKAAAKNSAPKTAPATVASSTPDAAKPGSGKTEATAAAPMPAPDEVRDVTLDFHFAANPTISGPRWIVAALREPLTAPPGSTLRVAIIHGRGITEKPAPIRRLRIASSADTRWTTLGTDPEIAHKAARVTDLLAEVARIPGIDLPVMEDMPANERRETRLFTRGNFLTKEGEPLTAGTPTLFPPLPAGEPVNRLTLARWFFRPEHPLTARVAVNRFWEQLFGIGIVETLEDFGSVGEKPSHPALLDWLALHFQNDLHWDMKALLRELVTSATYRQDSTATPESITRDPRNRLLARGPRQRLTAEMVRDQALAASGLLSEKMHGPPVMPSQPEGVWQTVYNNTKWIESKGEDAHRRAVYTFWKRSAAYPSFLTFDMPGRDLCLARRTPTNTPLQALVTMNDAAYHEASRALAQRMVREGAAATPDARIARSFELVVSRPPNAHEATRLRQLYNDADGAAPGSGDNDERELFALSAVATAILNLDAALVR